MVVSIQLHTKYYSMQVISAYLYLDIDLQMSSYFVLSKQHHQCLHVVSLYMISCVPQEPEMNRHNLLIGVTKS